MKHRSLFWYRFFQVHAFVGMVAAAFLLGVVWTSSRPSGEPPSATLSGRAEPAGPETAPSIGADQNPILSVGTKADFQPRSALLIGANELIFHHARVFQDMVRAVHDRVPVIALVNNNDEADLARDLLAEIGLRYDTIHFLQHPLNSMWLRDYGPIFARWSDGRVSVVSAHYQPGDDIRERDNAFNEFVARRLRLPFSRMPLTLEGGNLMFNGDGLLVTTTRVLQREENRHLDIEAMTEIFHRYLGSRVWVYVRELDGEPTGHVDNFVVFLRRNLVLVAQADAGQDPVNAAILDEAAELLSGQETQMGPLIVERIPMPPRTEEGFWRSYCNVLLVNGVILMPSFADVDPAIEQAAEDTYARLMPSWRVVRISADSLVSSHGLLHCIGIGIPGNVNIANLLNITLGP